jgi:serine protease Do
MDNEYMQEQEQQGQEQSEARPASPFADSPYVAAPIQDAPKQKPKKQKCAMRGISVALLLAILVAGCGATALGVSIYWNQKIRTFNDVVDNKLSVLQEKIDAFEGAAVPGQTVPSTNGDTPLGKIYADNVNAVVAISNEGLTTNIYGQVSRTASSGSGFIISEDGYVVSNYHVVEGAQRLRVIMSDSTDYEAKLVGFDSVNDLAVLKIDATGLPHVKLGSSDALAVGDQVLAIGNPLGELTSTLTVGYISAKDRMVNTDGTSLNMLQTDAAINSGNSGGPLFNMRGEVVGITTAKYSGTSASGATIEGIGFAIPMDDVADMIDELVKDGFISGAYLGVMVRDVDPTVSQSYGIPMGVYVESVTAGSCAEKAGVLAKDIIVNLGGHEVTSMATLTRALRKFEPGDTTTITVSRAGTQEHLEITLDQKPVETEQQAEPEATTPAVSPNYGIFDDWFGNILP